MSARFAETYESRGTMIGVSIDSWWAVSARGVPALRSSTIKWSHN